MYRIHFHFPFLKWEIITYVKCEYFDWSNYLFLSSTGANFTDAWVSQAATATATGAVLSPHQDGHDDWDDEGRPDSGMSGGRYDDDEVDDEEAEEDAEYLDQETVDEFEDRVLNKRAAKVKISHLTSQISFPYMLNLMKFWRRYLRLKTIDTNSKFNFVSTFIAWALPLTLNISVNS